MYCLNKKIELLLSFDFFTAMAVPALRMTQFRHIEHNQFQFIEMNEVEI